MNDKKINKIAKNLIASFDDEEENQEIDMEKINMDFFNQKVKTQNIPNFTKQYSESDDALVYFYNNDEMQSNYIIFCEDNGVWNYTVYVNEQIDTEVEKETCEEAFNDLISNIHKYVQKFDDALFEREAEMQQEERFFGKFSIKRANQIKAKKLFEDYDYIENEEYYIAIFYPQINDKIAIQENLNKIADEIALNTSKKFISKNYIVLQILNRSDLTYASKEIKSYGWVQK